MRALQHLACSPRLVARPAVRDDLPGAYVRWPHVTFDCEGTRDPNAMVRELEATAVKVENVRRRGSGPRDCVYFSDPCGNRLELSTDPA